MKTQRVTLDDVWPGDVIVTKDGNVKVVTVTPYNELRGWDVCVLIDGGGMLYRSWADEVHRVTADI